MVSVRKVSLATVVALGLLMFSVGVGIADDKLKIQISCPPITTGVPVTMLFRCINTSAKPIIFNKLVFTYLNPDMTVKGPYLRNFPTPITVGAATYKDLAATFTITTQQPSGALVPLLVTAWYQNITVGCDKGVGAGAAVVK